jgi:hypothetical protein
MRNLRIVENPFAAAPERISPLPTHGHPRIPFAPEFGRHVLQIEPELRRHADSAVRNRSTRRRPFRLTARSRDCHRAGPTDTPDCSPAHLAFGRSTWCPLTVPSMGRPADPRRPTFQGRDNRRSERRGPGGLDVGAHADRIVLRIYRSTLSSDFVPHGTPEGLLKISRSHGGQHWCLPSPSSAARWHRRLARTRVPPRLSASRLSSRTSGRAPCAPVPTTRRRQSHGIFSESDSGV